MFDKWFNVPAHFYLQVAALLILAIGVSTSNVFMSIGTIWLLANWMLEGDFSNKFQRFTQKPTLWVVVFLFFFGVLSLLWSKDMAYGLADIRIKLPFIVIPLVLATSKPLTKTVFYAIIYVFLGTVVVTSVWNYYQYTSHISEVQDVRQMSRFISHVRFSVLINFGIFFSYYLLLKRKLHFIILIPIMIWLVFYSYKSQVVNGYGLFVILTILSVVYWVQHLKQKHIKKYIFGGLAVISILILVGIVYVWRQAPIEVPKVDYATLPLYTANNNAYYHQKNTNITENGRLVYLYVSEVESRNAWAKRSAVSFDSVDARGHQIAGTIYRYMTSKNLTKDSIGFLSLTDTDIHNIEMGHSNHQINRGLVEKISDLKMQLFMLKSNGDPNGNSLIQRQLHLLAAGEILKENWLFGVGIGDVQTEFTNRYNANKSLLKLENQHRSHNQFLTIWISHGLLGFLALSLLWILPFYKYLKSCDYLLCVVLIAFGFSFLWQDMLETQAGVTIFALFYSLMVFKNRAHVED